jgi:hypothetical protein
MIKVVGTTQGGQNSETRAEMKPDPDSIGAQLCADKGCIGSYTKLCDFTLLFMILQVELQLNKGSLVRPRLVDQVKAHASIMTICEH